MRRTGVEFDGLTKTEYFENDDKIHVKKSFDAAPVIDTVTTMREAIDQKKCVSKGGMGLLGATVPNNILEQIYKTDPETKTDGKKLLRHIRDNFPKFLVAEKRYVR